MVSATKIRFGYVYIFFVPNYYVILNNTQNLITTTTTHNNYNYNNNYYYYTLANPSTNNIFSTKLQNTNAITINYNVPNNTTASLNTTQKINYSQIQAISLKFNMISYNNTSYGLNWYQFRSNLPLTSTNQLTDIKFATSEQNLTNGNYSYTLSNFTKTYYDSSQTLSGINDNLIVQIYYTTDRIYIRIIKKDNNPISILKHETNTLQYTLTTQDTGLYYKICHQQGNNDIYVITESPSNMYYNLHYESKAYVDIQGTFNTLKNQ